jgi:hypothetical protein
MRYWLLSLALLLLCGCGDIPQAESDTSTPVAKNSAPVVQRERPPAPQYNAGDFSDIPAALAALGTAAEAGDQTGITKADMWLAHQGAAAVQPCSEVLQKGQSDAQRVAVTRVLVQLPGGKPALLAATKVDSKIVRINVIQSLTRIQPVDKDVVAVCIQAIEEDEPEVQKHAIAALGKIGAPAKDAVPLIQKILNDTTYNDTVRAQARDTLKKIDPRKGLMGLNDE